MSEFAGLYNDDLDPEFIHPHAQYVREILASIFGQTIDRDIRQRHMAFYTGNIYNSTWKITP